MCTEIKNYTEEPSKTEFYPTPVDVVEKMLSYINLGKVHTVLEPSALFTPMRNIVGITQAHSIFQRLQICSKM